MKRALVIGDEEYRSSIVAISRLLAAGYEVIAMSKHQPTDCSEPLPHADACESLTHERLRWHCFDVSDDRFLYGIENALQGAPVDVLVYLDAPKHFSALRAATGHLWGYACVGSTETAMLIKGLDARIQTAARA